MRQSCGSFRILTTITLQESLVVFEWYGLRRGAVKASAVAIARTASEGNVSAQDAVLELIDEQQPRLVLTVGIAGAVPTSDVSSRATWCSQRTSTT